jgi:hypothetical protein
VIWLRIGRRASRGSLALLLAVLALATAAWASTGVPVLHRSAALSQSACWSRAEADGSLHLTARRFASTSQKRSPQTLLDAVLTRLGDKRFIRAAGLGPIPPITRMHNGYFGSSRPPKDGLWLYMAVPAAVEPRAAASQKPLSPARVATISRAQWEAYLVAGAVRDEFCLHGTRPLIGWTLANRGIVGISDASYAFAQRFRNPGSAWLLDQLHRIGKRFHFLVESVHYLHPLQAAPVVVLRTDRPAVFAGNETVILNSLHITQGLSVGWPYEGYYIEVRDGDGRPFLISSTVLRGTDRGSFYCYAAVPTCPRPPIPPSHRNKRK